MNPTEDVVKILDYRDFYDKPRAFMVEIPAGGVLYFNCEFREDIDAYAAYYTIVAIPRPFNEIPSAWKDIDLTGCYKVGKIPLDTVEFDVGNLHLRSPYVSIKNINTLFNLFDEHKTFLKSAGVSDSWFLDRKTCDPLIVKTATEKAQARR
jgi:hypothetical protein